MKKVVTLIVSILLLSSCADIITIADGCIYYDYDALIAYEIYNQLYKNDSTKYTKPIIFKMNIKKEGKE
jgi:hypothetical protein